MLVQTFVAAFGYLILHPGQDFSSTLLAWAGIIVLVWGAVYGLARAKNRDVESWLSATFVFGAFALAILAVLPSKKLSDFVARARRKEMSAPPQPANKP